MSDADYHAGWDAGFRKGLAAMEAGFTAHDMAQAREEGYSAGVQRAAAYEGILLDLIAELRGYQEDLDATERALDAYGECLCDVAGQAGLCTMHNPRRVVNMADHAEDRLREVRGE